MKQECGDDDWKRIFSAFEFNEEVNFREDFPRLSKKYGLAYISYLKAAYAVKDTMLDSEFCFINGQVPISFLNNRIK